MLPFLSSLCCVLGSTDGGSLADTFSGHHLLYSKRLKVLTLKKPLSFFPDCRPWTPVRTSQNLGHPPRVERLSSHGASPYPCVSMQHTR